MVKLKNTLTKIWNDDSQSDFSNPFCSLLYTFSLIYGGIVYFRNLLYDRGAFQTKRLPHPVVSVGNLTAGGTGKTPMVILLADLLRNAGYRPAVLSRGYAGKSQSSVNVISDGSRLFRNSVDAGDEPYLIAASAGVPVLTGSDRFATGLHAVEQLGADVLLLDDAFQHRGVFRDLNILLLDSERPFGNGHTLPRGPLREPRSAMKRADMIVLTRSDEGAEKTTLEKDLEIEFPGMPVFRAVHRPKELIRLSPSNLNVSFPRKRESGSEKTWIPDQVRDDNLLLKNDFFPPEFLRGKRICAFAGIADPESFRETIESLGGEVVAFKSFPDHYPYTAGDVEAIRKSAQEMQADITLTTEKDGVKLTGLSFSLPHIYALRIEMVIIREEEKFASEILAKLKR